MKHLYRMSVCKGLLISFLLFPLLLSGQSIPDRLKEKLPELRAYIQEKMAAGKIPGFSVAVGYKDNILWEEGFGVADKETAVAATPHTAYTVGSVTKTMTMTALMQMVRAGKINLDAPVSRYLKGAKITAGNYPPDSITIRKIASHTAGLARHTTLYYQDEEVMTLPLSDLINEYGVIVRPPSETYEYSDLGYGILAQVMADVSGEPYAAYMQKNFFQPLRLEDSFIDIGFAKAKSVAASYTARGEKIPPYYSPISGAAAAYSSVHDIVQLGIYHLQPKNSVYLAEMQKSRVQRAPGYHYGMAWHIYNNYGGYKVLTHHGHNGYATATFFLLPEQQICIAAATNTSTPLPEEVGEKILSMILPAFNAESLTNERKTWSTPSAPFKVEEAWLGHWKGEIAFDTLKIPLQLWFQADGDVHVQLQNQYRTLLNGTRLQEGYLRGSFNGELNIPGLKNYPSNLHLKIKLRGAEAMNGSLTQSSNTGTDRVSVLSYAVNLLKEKQ